MAYASCGLRLIASGQSQSAWKTWYPFVVIIYFTFMNASILRLLVSCALKNTKCDWFPAESEVNASLENGSFAHLLECLDLEAELEETGWQSDDELSQEAQLDGFFDEFPEALPELAKRWESEAKATGTGWTGGL